MTDDELKLVLDALAATQVKPKELEFRLYYDEHGKVVTYTSENLPGNFITITKQQYAEARSDVIVKDGKIVTTHKAVHVDKYTKNLVEGVKTSKYDINILSDVDYVYWKFEQHDIR